MDAHGIAQVQPGAVGIHLSWSGPPAWGYAPGGWTVQRRPAGRIDARDCELLDASGLAGLRLTRERTLRFGVLTLRTSAWVEPLATPGLSVPGLSTPGLSVPTPTETFRVDLDRAHRMARVTVAAKLSFAIACCEGRVVAVSGPVAGPATHVLRAARIDAVLLITLATTSLQVCVDLGVDETAQWRDVPAIVTGLTLPLRELMPSLTSADDELAEARSRLRPGELLAQEEFTRLTAVVRPTLRAAGPPRPSSLAMLLREEPGADADEVQVLDPIRVPLVHPMWRRALGFAWFDDDPALVPAQAYEYRISATFPDEDLHDADHGFATVPTGTLLPTDFTIDAVRFRLPQPVAVQMAPGTPAAGAVRVTRRGIPLDGKRDPSWLTPSLDDWSLVIDLPTPSATVTLGLAEGHDLSFAAGSPAGPFVATSPVPAGPRPRLFFGGPCDQIRLRGRGFLHAVRVSSAGPEPALESVVLAPITLVDTHLPLPPLAVTAENLQVAVPAPTSALPNGDVPARHNLGFRVAWRPVPAFGLTAWPVDLEVAAPLESAAFEVQRRAEPAGDWTPVLGEGEWTLGDRDTSIRDLRLTPGTELLGVFPESASQPGGADLDLALVDAFTPGAGSVPAPGLPAPGLPVPDLPVPGEFVRYRVRTIDAIGRPSPAWTESAPARLEKHLPPPVPVGPQDASNDIAGVQVRVLVRDAPDLTAAETALLGASENAIVLRWGWHGAQREQDPFAREFRVYVAAPMDAVDGTVVSVTTLGTGAVTSYQVALDLDRAIGVDVAAGLRLDAGHPFLIRSHTAGSSITMVVETRLRVLGAAPVPASGPVRLNLPMAADRMRPPAWGDRIQVVPLTAGPAFDVVLRDQLTLTPEHPVDSVWLGVSAADDQAYVADQLATGNRPGNESAIVPVRAAGRYAGRPTLEVPPPLAPVPVLRTPEPGAEPLYFPLDLTAHLPASALSTGLVRHERVSAGALLDALFVTPDGRVLARPVEPLASGDQDVEIAVPNPADRAELVAALSAGPSTAVADRFLVYLAGQHRYRDRLFVASHDDALPPGPFAETLPPASDRWVYRVRAVDAAGHVSIGSAVARVVVRVPSLLAGAPPVRVPRHPDDPPGSVRVRVPADPSVGHVLLFNAPSVGVGPVEVSEVARVPNRPDLMPAGGLWLRAPDATLLAPTASPLDGPAVLVAPDGSREVALAVPGGPGARTRVWLATLTHDGIPSALTGPYTVEIPE